MFALWGLNDLGAADGEVEAGERTRARDAFALGAETLARRLPRYRARPGWSRYDLYPHPIAHVASPFYHRLHIEMLAAMTELAKFPVYEEIAAEWERGERSRFDTGCAIVRKVAFRMLRPRSGLLTRVMPGGRSAS
jgi:heparosan-N-sulfate-glucuronate 5-epimerase